MDRHLPHNVLPDLPSRPQAQNESAAFSQLRTSLIKVLRNSPESRVPICDALELVEALQQKIEAKRNPDAPPSRAGPRAGGDAGTGGAQEYLIQSTHEGQFLTERRPSGSQPFRCPKDAYEAAARVIAEADGPLHFEDIHDRLNRAMGERQADYRVRVCLRFWLNHRVIERFRTRYRAKEPGGFFKQAMGLWEQST